MKILLADDNKRIRSSLTRALTGRGHQVKSVGTIDAARTQLSIEQFDVILIDDRFDRTGDGVEYAQALHQAGFKVILIGIHPRTEPISVRCISKYRPQEIASILEVLQRAPNKAAR